MEFGTASWVRRKRGPSKRTLDSRSAPQFGQNCTSRAPLLRGQLQLCSNKHAMLNTPLWVTAIHFTFRNNPLPMRCAPKRPGDLGDEARYQPLELIG